MSRDVHSKDFLFQHQFVDFGIFGDIGILEFHKVVVDKRVEQRHLSAFRIFLVAGDGVHNLFVTCHKRRAGFSKAIEHAAFDHTFNHTLIDVYAAYAV